MRRILMIIVILALSYMAQAQEKEYRPVVGKPCPDFVLTDVNFYPKKEVALKDFRGRWLIIDCWNRYCSNCIKAMPKMDSIRKELHEKLELIYVGYTGYLHSKQSDDKAIRSLYERIRTEQNLELPMAFDSLLMDRFKIGATPYIIIIDPTGVVRGVTTYVNRDIINRLMAGEKVELKKAYRWQKGVGRIE